jgi:hypothetical protein
MAATSFRGARSHRTTLDGRNAPVWRNLEADSYERSQFYSSRCRRHEVGNGDLHRNPRAEGRSPPLRYVSYKDRRAVDKDLKPIYTAANREQAETALDAFEKKWGRRCEMITTSWRSNWERIVPFLDFPEPIRKVIYTTNAIESLNSSLRKLLRYRGHFPNDDALLKVLYLALRRYDDKWCRSIRDWSTILGQFAIFFKNRIPAL